MKQVLFLITSLLLFTFAFGQDKPAYILYNAKGKKVKYEKMIRDLSSKDIVLFGEFHTTLLRIGCNWK